MSQRCIFCGDSPTTKEHLWPDWIGRKLGIEDRFDHRFAVEVEGQSPRERTYSRTPFTQTVRAVCRQCNTGWMKQVELGAKPLLDPLLEFRGVFLGSGEQRALTTWTLLKALMFGETHAEAVVLPAHRDYLFAHRRPPRDGLWAWLATYDVADELLSYRPVAAALEGSTIPDTYSATITTGPVVLHVVGSSLAYDLTAARFGKLAATQIWPPPGVVAHENDQPMTSAQLSWFGSAMLSRLSGRDSPYPA